MIPRYSRKLMSSIWEDKNKYKIWLDIEIAACEAMHELGDLNAEDLKKIQLNAKFDIPRILEIEEKVKHDIIAFTTSVSESLGEESRFIHKGLTSSDVLDSCLSIQLQQASDILIEDVDQLLLKLKEKSYQYKDLITVGRSHGIHAEPTSFGLKIARFYAEFTRNKARLENAKKEISICKISGAVGTFANINPYIEEYVAKKFNLTTETISSQIIPRDRHANFFNTLALIASSLENIATEIRHLQRTELSEAEEFFNPEQKGSSAMPHKRNPVLSENITGIARMIRSFALPAMENITLWHERDISHSSVERVLAPDATILTDFALARTKGVIENLIVYPEKVTSNLNELRGLIYSQRVLITLVDKGMSREDAYKLVQYNAMLVWQNKEKFFKDTLLNDDNVMQIMTKSELEHIFDEKYYIRYVNDIFSKIFD